VKRILEHIREHLLNKTPTLEELRCESSSQVNNFLQYMKNRLSMGRLRYGKKFIGTYDCVGRMAELLKEYKRTGNDKLLVDLANYALLESVYGVHPKKHFKSGDDGKHCETNQT